MMSKPLQKGRKRRSEDSAVGSCILCQLDCDEDRSNTGIQAWTNLQEHAKQWIGLDTFGSIHQDVVWENGPKGIYFHQSCKITLFSDRKLQQALSRKHKSETEAIESTQMESDPSASQAPLEDGMRTTRSSTGLIHEKNLCIWCMKPKDEKHPSRDKWHIMQQLDAWYAFRCHTLYLWYQKNLRESRTLAHQWPSIGCRFLK